MSGGEFGIEAFDPGALTGGYAYYGPVSQGAIAAAWGTLGATQGKNSTFAFQSTWPFGPDATEFLGWMLHGGNAQLAEELYAKDSINTCFAA